MPKMLLRTYLSMALMLSSKCLADVNTMTDKIIKDILKDYKAESRPAGKLSDRGVSLGINIVPLHVNVASDTSTLHSHVWFVMRWTDTRLKWVPTNYENVSTVHLAPDKIWRPDIMVYNSVEHFDYEKTEILVLSDGTVSCIIQMLLHTMWFYPRSGGFLQ